MAQAPYPIMNMKDGSTKMSDGTILPAGVNPSTITWKEDTTWQTPVTARSLNDNVASNAWRKNIQTKVHNIPAINNAISQANAPIALAINPLWNLPKPPDAPLVKKPLVSYAPVISNTVKIPEAEWVLQAALQRWLQPSTPVVSSNAGRKNIQTTIRTPASTTLASIPQDTWAISGTATTKLSTSQQTPEQVAKEKEDRLNILNKADIAQKNLELSKWTNVLQTNNKILMRLYGIDDKGNVDTTNPNGLASRIEQSKLSYETQKNALLWEYSSARLRKVQSQMRQLLTSRGIDITKIPPEQLIQLSWEIGNVAFNDVYTAKEKTVNDILQNWAQAEDKINALREKWVLSQNDLRIATETLRSNVLGDINTINKQFANDLFGIKDKTREDIQSRKSAAINAITQFWAQLGLTGNKLWAITSYMNNFSNPTDAITAMMQDLNTPSSAIYKTVWAITAQQMAAAVSAMKLKQQEVDAKTIAANARLQSASNASSVSKESKFSAAQQAWLANLWYPWVVTPSQLTAVYSQVDDAAKKNIDLVLKQAGEQYQ